MQEEKKRELWADYAKGICILLVYIGHLDIIPQVLRIFIYLFHMPMFFFCMGYYTKTSIDAKTFIKKKAVSLLVPYFSYCIIYEILYLDIILPLIKGGFDKKEILDDLLGMLLQNRNGNMANIWFLTASFVAMIIYYVLRNLIKNEKIEIIIVLIISLTLVYVTKFFEFALYWYVDVAFPCLVFVYFGKFVKDRKLALKPLKILMLFLIGIASSVAIYFVLIKDSEKFLVDYHMIRLFPYSLVLLGGISICLALYGALSYIKKESYLSFVGKNSLLYYLWNSISANVMVRLLLHFKLSNNYLLIVARFVAIIIFTPFIVWFIKYFCWFLFGVKREKPSFLKLFKKKQEKL